MQSINNPIDFNLNDLLLAISKSLDISASQYQTVIERYTDVAIHLAKQTSMLFPYKPDIKPQGSFLLGTMIQPANSYYDLDIDLVCRLHGKKADWTQQNVKDAVGIQLKMFNTDVYKLTEEGNRCWTLTHRKDAGFHMDILPAIVGLNHFTVFEKSFYASDHLQTDQIALRITDKRRADYYYQTAPEQWLKSNPFGYAAWFRSCASITSSKSFSLQEMIEPLPAYSEYKEPLIRAIQILKRHRDIMFGGDINKPASIIITTLAARCYKKETELLPALNNILKDMGTFIEEHFSTELQRTIKWISNPVNDKENFADSWLYGNEGSRKEYQFYRWLKKARTDFDQLNNCTIQHSHTYCKIILGVDIAELKMFSLDE